MIALKRILSFLICLMMTILLSHSFAAFDPDLSDVYSKTQVYYLSESPLLVYKTIESFGLEAMPLTDKDFDNDFTSISNILIQGSSVELTQSQLTALQSFVDRGGHLGIWGSISLAESFDFKFGSKTSVSGVVESLNSDLKVYWPSQLSRYPLLSDDSLSVFTIFEDSKGIATAGRPYGLGKVFYSSDMIYSYDSQDIIVFPYLMNNMSSFLDLNPIKRIDDVRVYMDWGYYYDMAPSDIVDTLVQAGVSEVHLSAWYDIERVDNFYEAFIAQCHANGILVYAWLELPMVTKEFFDASESVRQKNAFGEYAVIGWRSLVALEDPAVNELAKAEVTKLLDAFNWDGINLAELYFEPAGGFFFVNDITPFSDYFINEFKKKYGENPADIFTGDSRLPSSKQTEIIDAYVDERIQLITDLNVDYIHYFEEFFPELDLYITLIDDSVDPEISKHIGSDSTLIMTALETSDVKLQIEDPFYLWSDQSNRYLDIGEHFGSLYPKNFESIDINVVERDAAFPTSKQTGVEYNLVLYDGAAYKNNVHLYALNTVNDIDLKHSPYILGAYVNIKPFENDLLIESPVSFKIEGDFSDSLIMRNKVLWPFRSETAVVLPKGHSLLGFQQASSSIDSTPNITNITVDIDDYVMLDNGIEIDYSSHRKGYLSTDTSIEEFLIDGEFADTDLYFNGAEFTIALPAGSHSLTLTWSDHSRPLIAMNCLVKYTDLEPIIIGSTRYYNALDLLDFIGSDYSYHSEYRTLSASFGNHTFWLQANNPAALVDGQDIYMEESATLIDGILYLPIDFVLDVFQLDSSTSKNVLNIFTK